MSQHRVMYFVDSVSIITLLELFFLYDKIKWQGWNFEILEHIIVGLYYTQNFITLKVVSNFV